MTSSPCRSVAAAPEDPSPLRPRPQGLATTTGRHRASLADRKSTRLNSSHLVISYAVFCLKKKNKECVLHPAPIAASACFARSAPAIFPAPPLFASHDLVSAWIAYCQLPLFFQSLTHRRAF